MKVSRSDHPVLGVAVILASTLLFASATVLAKYATQTGDAQALHVTMARFLLGVAFVLPVVVRSPSIVRPRVPLWVWLRAVSNVLAVFLFFYGIQLTTVSKANLLNMTYPVFVFLFAPAITGEKTSPVLLVLLLVTLTGVWNVVRPEQLGDFTSIATGDFFAFGSAIVAGFAISTLRRARAADSSMTIIFYMMVVGTLANGVMLFFVPPPAREMLLLIAGAGGCGALGQVALTFGFRHVSAAVGSLLSTARIPMAVVLGVILFADPVTPRTILGALLILGSLVGVSLYNPGSPAAPGNTDNQGV